MIKKLLYLHNYILKLKTPVLLFIIETILFVYLFWWVYDKLVIRFSFIILATLFILGSYLGFILAYSRLRIYILLFINGLIFFCVYLTTISTSGFISDYFENDFILYNFESYYFFIIFFFSSGFVINILMFRWKRFLYIELVLFSGVMIFLFNEHRDYKLSRLNIFDRYMIQGISDLNIFILIITVFFLLLYIYFFFAEEISQHYNLTLTRINGKSAKLKLIFILVSLLFLVYQLQKSLIHEEEPKLSGGIPLFNTLTKLYPHVDISDKRLLIAKINHQQSSNKRIYISKDILSHFNQDLMVFTKRYTVIDREYKLNHENIYSGSEYYQFKPIKHSMAQYILLLSNLFSMNGQSLIKDVYNTFRMTKSKFVTNENRVLIEQEYYITNPYFKNVQLGINYPILRKNIVNKNPEKFVSTFRVESKEFVGDYSKLNKIENYDNLYPDEFKYYTNTTTNLRYLELAKQITQNAKLPVDKVLAIINYFKNNYKLSTRPGGNDRKDLLTYFIFDNKKGYSTYFAYSIVLLLRSIKIPSRVVTGIMIEANNNQIDNFYSIRQKDLHAWVEVYFNEYGWIVFDATPVSQDASYYIMYQNNDSSYLMSLLKDLEKKTDDKYITGNKTSPTDPMNNISMPSTISSNVYLYIYIAISFVIIILLIILLLKKYYINLCQKEKNIKNKVFLYYQYAISRLSDLYYVRNKQETAYEYSKRLYNNYKIDIRTLTSMYIRVKFNNNIPDSYFKQIEQEYINWIYSLENSIPKWKRFISMFNISFFISYSALNFKKDF